MVTTDESKLFEKWNKQSVSAGLLIQYIVSVCLNLDEFDKTFGFDLNSDQLSTEKDLNNLPELLKLNKVNFDGKLVNSQNYGVRYFARGTSGIRCELLEFYDIATNKIHWRGNVIINK